VVPAVGAGHAVLATPVAPQHRSLISQSTPESTQVWSQMCSGVHVPVQQSASLTQWWPASWHAQVVPLQTMKPQHVPFATSSQAAPDPRQHWFAYVEPIVESPNVSSTDEHAMPVVGIAQHAVVEPGAHAAPFVSVHVEPAQMPLLQAAPPHALPHEPQLFGSVSVSTQVLLVAQKLGVPLGHVQAPADVQTSGAAHVPVGGGAHAAAVAQLPSTQLWPLQDVPQAPQWLGSVRTSTQPALPQLVSPAAQPHLPAAQESPASHAWLQVPQLLESVCRSVHVPDVEPGGTHDVSPVAQPHLPAAHVRPAAQAFAQEPQWASSVLTSAQIVPHGIVGVPQPHTPPPHGSPGTQA